MTVKMECVCYREQKDIALVSLSNILHHVHYSNEAAIVIHAAIDISRERSINYFTLGNIYAVMMTAVGCRLWP